MRSAQTEVTFCKECKLLTCEETYSMQSSSFDSIGMKPSLFTDKVGEFSFCKDKEKVRFEVIPNKNIYNAPALGLYDQNFFSFGKVPTPRGVFVCNFRPGCIKDFVSIFIFIFMCR